MSTKVIIVQCSSGDNIEILDLEDSPELVLVELCSTILRHHNLRNPSSQNTLRQLNEALKQMSGKTPAAIYASDNRFLKAAVAEIDKILIRFTKRLKVERMRQAFYNSRGKPHTS